jgi:hypothetical protein
MLSIGYVLQGRFALGTSRLAKYIADRDEDEYSALATWARVFLAEVYLEMVAGQKKPSLRVMLRNLPFLVRALPFAASRALDLLMRASANEQIGKTGVIFARINFDLGIVHRIKRRPAEARRHFTTARDAAATFNATALLARTDTALSSLA